MKFQVTASKKSKRIRIEITKGNFLELDLKAARWLSLHLVKAVLDIEPEDKMASLMLKLVDLKDRKFLENLEKQIDRENALVN